MNTKRFVGDDGGHVQELHTVRIEWVRNEQGRMVAQEVPGSGEVLKTQLVLLALGFTGPEDTLLDQLGVERDERSNAKAEFGVQTTNIEGVFTAGDMRRGQSLVVWAIQEGRQTAREVDCYLMGASDLPK
ncbi:Glutamate synthase [NADPH] small chain [compost metagenome]